MPDAGRHYKWYCTCTGIMRQEHWGTGSVSALRRSPLCQPCQDAYQHSSSFILEWEQRPGDGVRRRTANTQADVAAEQWTEAGMGLAGA
ncbi:hypothetical protein V496_09642 [Pseudogymnoascus sp. VKM F-4515 (FW-2607)]|nr:hypothetical protein V496_09642 [Pseudogymnoascus sp. VKM F-4515 (FW-2607)]